MKHDLFDRDDDLAHCKVCGGAEATLPAECPGRRMTAAEQLSVQRGTLDFRAGVWVRLLQHAVYRGDQFPTLNGEGALVRPSLHGSAFVLAQFDNLDLEHAGQRLAMGWHEFPAADFTPDSGETTWLS